MRRAQLLEPLLELPQTPLNAPVVQVGADLQHKAAGQGIVLHPLERKRAVIGLLQKL